MSPRRKSPVIDLATVRLTAGAHDGPTDGACVMELASYLAHEPWSDHPRCVSPVIGAFLRRWNDALDDTTRQRLVPYAARVLSTATGAADEETRAWLATDWLVRVFTPAWMDVAGLSDDAARLRALPMLTSPETVSGGRDVLAAARERADATTDAARAAARAAARDAATDAAGAAARAATTATDAAWAAARAATTAAAWDATTAAAWDATTAAAGAAARAAITLTGHTLQTSAFDLLDRMLAVGQSAAVAR